MFATKCLTLLYKNNVKISPLSTLSLVQRCISIHSRLSRSHYDSLGVTPSATQNDIKQAYYKLSKLYHPDKNRGSDVAAEKFRLITSAYEVLGNYKLRRLYDKGILHTAGQNYAHHEATEPVEDDPTTKFYKSRMQRTNAPTAEGRTPIYDFDEWSRAHYGENFQRNQKAKARYEKREEQAKASLASTQNEYIIFGLLLFITLYLMVYYYNETSYDRVRKAATAKQKEE